MNRFVKIAGIIALSATEAAGTSLWASDARADDEADAMTVNNDNLGGENTAESSEPLVAQPWWGPGRFWGGGAWWGGNRWFGNPWWGGGAWWGPNRWWGGGAWWGGNRWFGGPWWR